MSQLVIRSCDNCRHFDGVRHVGGVRWVLCSAHEDKKTASVDPHWGCAMFADASGGQQQKELF